MLYVVRATGELEVTGHRIADADAAQASPESGVRSRMVCTVKSGTQVHGALWLTSAVDQAFTDSHQVLADSVARHNGFCETGVDADFGKGSSAYNTSFGIATLKNPNLAPIVRAPFVALRIHAATLGTTLGLKTTGDACVVDASDQPIPGLYACGNEFASAMRGLYPGGGVTLGPAIAFAYRAVRQAAGKPL